MWNMGTWLMTHDCPKALLSWTPGAKSGFHRDPDIRRPEHQSPYHLSLGLMIQSFRRRQLWLPKTVENAPAQHRGFQRVWHLPSGPSGNLTVSHWKWWFSIVMLRFTRGYMFHFLAVAFFRAPLNLPWRQTRASKRRRRRSFSRPSHPQQSRSYLTTSWERRSQLTFTTSKKIKCGDCIGNTVNPCICSHACDVSYVYIYNIYVHKVHKYVYSHNA